MILKILLFVFIFCSNNAFCSAWTRKSGDSLVIFEMLNESTYSKTLFANTNDDYYRTTAYKIYFEHGLTDKITLGGYLKNYNFYSQYFADGLKMNNEIKNDYYANIFILQNIYNKNNNLFSLQYSIYAPLSYSDTSDYINPIDTKYSVELSVLYGIDGEIPYEDLLLRYFINTGLSYRLVRESKYDQLDFNYLMGFRLNESSTFSISYECKYYFENGLMENNSEAFNYYYANTINQIKLSWNYKFLDNLATDFAFYKNYSKYNATGTMFSFFFYF